MRQPSVTSQLATEFKTSQALHRRLLEKETSSIKYLLRQGMVRTGAIKAVLDSYEALKETCKDVADEGGDVGLKADGMLKRLKQFLMLFGLRLSYLVFSAGEELSRTLQSKDCNIQEAINSSNLTGKYYKCMRSDEEFKGFYDGKIG